MFVFVLFCFPSDQALTLLTFPEHPCYNLGSPEAKSEDFVVLFIRKSGPQEQDKDSKG